ncbi:zf-HC2 domain-containing protein [Blastococcus mobilis]|uniref:Putative zinc-finger n=1 Tax=Blastococcus mobilis TaxID=1938746 RepID=A0A238WIZ9_9ACTN|nr:zf-HC2 domain-containing protein [Blastococcus mobilis]SNR46535.1 Putative zinc-finger [Blastococcus mobilis]
MTCPGPAATGLGAYVLGGLEPEERRRVEEHVAACPDCAAELAELRSLPALLDRVRVEDLDPVPVAPSPDLFARVSAAAADARRPGRLRRRTLALVAAAVLAVLGVGAGVTVWATGSGEQSVTASAGPVRATVIASTLDEGIALDVAVAGLRPGEICRMVAVDRDGGRHPAGEWPTSEAGDGRWRGWTDISRSALTEVVLLGDGGRELVRVPF